MRVWGAEPSGAAVFWDEGLGERMTVKGAGVSVLGRVGSEGVGGEGWG